MKPRDAEAEFHRIMTGAAEFQKQINSFVVSAALTKNPDHRRQMLDQATLAAERMAAAFRMARNTVSMSFPGYTLPTAPTPILPAAAPSAVIGGKRPIPRSL